jgi:hypothetical protein
MNLINALKPDTGFGVYPHREGMACNRFVLGL